jgi:hypothetical protein
VDLDEEKLKMIFKGRFLDDVCVACRALLLAQTDWMHLSEVAIGQAEAIVERALILPMLNNEVLPVTADYGNVVYAFCYLVLAGGVEVLGTDYFTTADKFVAERLAPGVPTKCRFSVAPASIQGSGVSLSFKMNDAAADSERPAVRLPNPSDN